MHKKRMLFLLLLGIGLFTIGMGGRFSKDLVEGKNNQNLIRLHVIANSNLNSDQLLKLQVRDAILAEITPEFKNLTSVKEAKFFLEKNLTRIEEIVKKEIARRGYNYPVKVEFGHFNFPTKQYGEMIFPAGDYEALRVVIGSGEGNNWWCVLFPPLCFVDITNGVAVQPRVDNSEDAIRENRPKIEYRLKIAELFKKDYQIAQQ